MFADVPFACKCGQVRGAIRNVSSASGDLLCCHCTDCQQFAYRFGAEDRILDANSGTLLYQSGCAAVQVAQGSDKLACIHLTDKPTLRWYADCCDTPMFNTYKNARFPYMSTLVANTPRDEREPLMPLRGHIFLSDVQGHESDLKELSMAYFARRFLVRVVRDFCTGARRRTALFDGATLEPIARPQRVDPA